MPHVELVAGLGNPGPQYAETRHNAGFWFVDALAAREGEVFRANPRFFGETCEVRLEGRRVRLLKPDTYMNRSGQSLAAIARFYRCPVESILVVHDEIDLPPGTVKLKRGGGHGGHNGLRDIVSALGSRDFARLRIGVGHPGSADDVVDYVLHRPSRDDAKSIVASIEEAMGQLPRILAGDLQGAMNALHRRSPRPDRSAADQETSPRQD